MKRAHDNDEGVEVVRVVRPRYERSVCAFLDWLPPEMRSHVRTFLGLRSRFRLHRVCHLLNEEDAQPLQPSILTFLSSTGDDRKARTRFWKCVDVLDDSGVTAWREFAYLHIDQGIATHDCLRGENVFFWRLPCYADYAEDGTRLFQSLRIILFPIGRIFLTRNDHGYLALNTMEARFSVIYNYPHTFWSGGANVLDANRFWLAAHREWLSQTIVAVQEHSLRAPIRAVVQTEGASCTQ